MTNEATVWVSRLTTGNAHDSFKISLDRLLISRANAIRSVGIKINLCDYRRSESGATTDPFLLGALVDVLHQRYPGATITIIENDATSVEIWSAYRLLGIEKVAREHGAELHNCAEGEWCMLPVPGGAIIEEIEVPNILKNLDLFINFAKLKTNGLTKMTGCLKNVFGLLRMKHKVSLHSHINQVLVDMNKVIKPDVCMVDGYIGLEGIGGPAFGRPKRCELLIGGCNPVAVDACSARIMGFRPSSVKHIKLCSKAGLGPMNYQLMTDIADFDYRHYRFRFEYLEYGLRNLLRKRVGFAV